jgi:hypothetical protein
MLTTSFTFLYASGASSANVSLPLDFTMMPLLSSSRDIDRPLHALMAAVLDSLLPAPWHVE